MMTKVQENELKLAKVYVDDCCEHWALREWILKGMTRSEIWERGKMQGIPNETP